jgi:hypothetical protein
MLLSQVTSPENSSYAPVVIEKDFSPIRAEMKADKSPLAKRQLA